MESKPAVNGHAALISHQENMPGANHLCQDIMPCKQKKAADRDVTVMDASSEPSKAAGSIAGVYVEVSKKIMSFYDATREHLLSLDSALCLLEAQAAMGFIIDPVKNRHVSVAEAVHLGLVGLELKERLLAAEKAATGFVDPYTEEKISLYQAIQKDLIEREQGTRLLEAQIATGGIIEPATGCRLPADVACERGYLDEEMSQLISDPSNEASKGFLNPSTMERVTYTELIKRCIVDPASGFLLLPLQITFPGLGGRVSSRDLFDSGIISSDMFRGLEEGRVSAQEVAENDSVQQFLHGTRSVAGVVLPSGERKSLYQALREHLLVPGTALMLLQVQASTGSLTDPIKNKSYSVDEAVRIGLIGPELHKKLSSAERTITGYRDPYTGEMLSLFQAIRKGFIPKDHGICLLEAQMATGGIIAPGRHLRVPTETACKWGYLDEATRQLLSSPTDDMKGFFDPSSKEKLTYADLLKRCVTDPNTGLLLLPIGGDSREESKGTHLFFDHRTQTTLENTQVSVALGKFKGKSVSLWKLLFSDYIQSEQRAALTQQYLAGMLSTQELGKAVSATIEEMASTANVTFEGLRDRVTADQLLSSEIINKDLFKKLKEGETSAKEVVGMDTVKKYLQGTGSIGGLLLPDSQEKISIYQAKRKGLLRPGTSLILLEAQAATGFIIDPAANKRYSVDEALRANIIGPDVYNKLLTAEKSVTGYRDPYSGNKISLFQAMKKEFIVKEHAIRLLEAQIATGGIIDPVNSHRIPVEVAYKRGYFDKKMNVILSDPSDDTKGFFDPNTHENLTYLQLKEKCITEPSTGLCLLPLNSRKRQFIDDDTRRVFRSSWLPVRFGRLRGEKVSVWDLLNSEYFSEGRRREIFNHYQLKKLTLEQIRIMLEEEMKKWAPIKFPAMRGSVSAYHLMETGVIDKALFEKVLEGSITPKEVLHMDSVRKYLYGSGSIGGVVLQPSNQRLSIYEAMKQNIVVPGVALPLLEAQAATGFIIDPVNNQKLCVDDAVKEGVIGPEVHEKLQHAEGAVTGYKDPFTGKKIPLFQAMKKGLIADSQAMQLMEVQMATGGIIDPACGHYIPIESAQKRGCLDEDTSKALSKPSDNNRTFCVPDSKETVTYAELIKRCQKDEISGFHLLPLPQTAAPAYTDEQIQQIFKETVVKEKGVSLWELIHSGYFTEEQGRHFVERFRSEEMSLEQLVALVLRLVEEMEMKARTQITFEGLRGSVPAVWLLDAGIITEKMFEELAQGRRAPEEVAAMESVKRYLQGTGSIAGVFIEASKKKMSFYDAMKNNLLLPGAALRLLEAQAATGYLTDPATNQRLSVRDAVKAAVVGEELTEKLLLAERAVTGYTDPYTGNSISLCQALRKELIPLEDAIPFLEAQLATGGVIDPIHHHHLPLQAACRYGFYDENLNQTLSRMNDSTKVFFDPNTKENVTYQQLKDRCIHEAESGLWLLPLSENVMFCVDEQTMEVMKSVTVCVNVGRFKGQTVSVWDLLNSEYLSDGKRRELVQKYKDENTEVLQEIVTSVTTIIKETETQGKKFAFRGLRKRVSASDLFQSQLIDKKTLDELNQGKKTVKEVTEMDSVRRYLEGSNFIAGVLIQPSNEKMSIYQAMRKGILRPGTALVLLEAQAATGYIIDPEKNKKFSVEEALTAGLIGGEIFEKLLCAERAVTGYTDPYTKAPMSLFEAMNQGLIVKSHGIRLLEAQIATGGIIDPVHSHRLPVEVAYRRGYFDQEMNQILSDPSDDTKGFFDPNTHENLTYMQLLERCVQDSETGLYMLQVVQEGGKYFYIDELTKQVLRLKPLKVKVGKFKDQTVSIWEILCSHYISEQKRKELVMQYKSKTLTLEDLTALIMKIIEDTEQRAEGLKVKGLRGYVSISELFNSEIIDKKTLDQLQDESLTLVSLTERDTIKRYLDGTGCIAGVLLPSRKEKMSIYQALNKGLLTEQCALGLLEAQAATGFLIDPLKNKKLSVDEAVSSGLVGRNLHKKLLSAEKAVTGYEDPHTGNKISLFQAIRQKIIVKEHGIRLLEAQIATGGIIDPVNSHRLPVEVAYRRGVLDDDMFILLSDPDHGTKGFIDPNTHEKISYSQLLQRCSKDRNTGLYLLQVMEKDDDYFYIDEHTKPALLCTKVEVPFGKYKGQVLSLWELLCSEYITEEKRKELIKKYKDESHNILQGIIDIILNIMKEKEEDRSDVWFQGIRQQITASELLSAGIITEETMENLHEGKERAQDIAKMDTVRKYLEGTGSIAGVLVPSKADPTKMEKMSIYQAMWKGILRQGTALVLLEAQAATGFLIDPCKNKKFSVDEAVSSGLVGSELQKKLLTADRAVTGYTDPCTGKKMSLFQAMKKELIVKEHGIRLLEAQIATGGIIDPVHSHRLPVEVAYRRGYFDQEMNQILSDPSDDTKGFFDPNTHENLTYMQLLHRCVPDPDTGLLMLQLMDKGSVLYQLTEDARKALQDARTTLSVGLFQGQSVTVWELLFSRYVPDHRRQDLLRKYKAGTVTISEMITLLTAIISTAEGQGHGTALARKPVQRETAPLAENGEATGPWQEQEQEQEQEQQLQRSLKSHTVEVSAGGFQGRKVSLWELLFSKYVSEAKRQELLGQARARSLALDELARLLTVLVEEAAEQSSKMKFPGLRRQVTASDLVDSGIIDKDTLADLVQGSKTVEEVTEMASVKRYLDGTGCIAGVLVPSKADPTKMEKMSIYQAMWKGILRQGTALVLLEAQAATGFLIDPLTNEKLSVDEAISSGLVGSELHEKLLSAERAVTGYTDPYTGDQISLFQAMKKELIVKEHGIRLLEAQIATGGIIDPVHSHRLPVEVAYRRGYFDQEMNQILSDPSDDTKGFFDPNTHENLTYMQLLHRCVPDPDTGLLMLQLMDKGSQEQEQQLQRSLKSHTVEVSAGGFQGRKVSLWELLFSKYVSEAKRQELLGQARARSLALDELARLLTVLVEEAAEQSSKMKFPGLRRQVTASDLVDSGIIDKDTLADLVQGSKTVEEVTEMASVKRYLDGTGCIAGVLVPSKADPTKMEKMSIYQAMWKGILRQGTALVLLEAQAATGFLIDPLTNEKLSVDEAISSGLVGSELHEKLLSAERAVTGYTDPYTGDQISLFQAMKKELIVKEHGIRLLEAQIATGGIIDPVHSHRLPVEVAYRRGYFDQEMNQILSDPSDDTKGFFDPNTHENLTYMQLLHRCVPDPDTGLLMLQLMDKGSVLYQLTEDARKALQDARTTLSVGLFQGQSVTVWELLFSRYVPDHRRQDLLRKYKAGTVTISEMITLLTAIISTAEGQGHGTALARKPVQRETAPLAENGEATGPWQEQEQEQEQEQQLQRSLKSHTVEVSAGGFQGRKVSLWELLFSKYVSEAKRQELLGQARARSLALDKLARLLTVLVEEAAEQSSKMKFPGLRRQVTASDLVDSGIIDKDTLADLVQGSKTVEEVTEMASVKRYLDGTGCIAGVLVPSKADPTKMEKMSIYQAMWKGILRQGTALVLLEAQAATGFLIDPLTNEKLSVDEAISSGLVGSELHEKLLSAERAVTGYTDPYTGDQISLFQAMKKELIVKEHGIRLLEAQIATGGIIDPVHSHRLPVEVAYRRGYFDQEMNQILSDPSDDTKGFFDPNTHENLTYMQLLHRCVPDPDTGLLMLQLMDKGSVLYQLTEDARKALQDARTTLSVGLFQGQSVTVWELLFSRYVPDHRRQDLLRKYKAGTVTISEMITLLTAIISTAEGQGHGTALARKPVQRETAPLAENGEATGPWQEQEQEQEQQLQRSLKSHTVEVSAGGFQGRKVSLWELLFSKYVSEAKRQELLGQARARSLALDELARLLTVLVEEAAEQSSKMKFPGLRRQVTASDLVDSGIIDKDTLADLVQGSKTVEEVTEMASVKRYLDGTGCIAGVLVPSKADPTKMEKMSIYQAMWKGILRQGTALVLLEAQAATGFLIDPLTNEKLSVDEAISSGLVGSELHEKLLSAERAVTGYTDPYTGDQISLFQAMKKELIVKEHGIRLLEAQIATGGIIDPVHSHRLPVEVAYRRGYFDQEMNQILSDPSDDTKGFFDPNTHENLTYMQLLHRCVPDPDTGLLMLQLMDKGSVLYQLTEDARKALQDARTTLSVGLFQGQSVTVWELLFSRYVPDHRRQDLLRKYKAGTVTISEMITLLTAIISTAEGQGHGTALARKPVQRETAPLAENGEATGPWQEQEQEQEQQLQRSLKSHTVEVSAGGFQGRKVSLWELLFSKYVSEAKRQELLGQARARSLALDELARLLTVLVEEAAEQSSKMKFPGLRRQVTASDLVDSGIIDKDTLADLVQGSKTVEEVTEMASVKRYLDGTGCIAGVLVPSKADPTKMEKMSIYQAMWKGILRQGTALVLLEAQAATGFLIDPLTNEKLSVDEAISSGLVGSELHEKLLSAERAVTGYTDPYTGDQISLFQAMKKELIVKEHGIRLLEAQIATGGIIDPVHSHRLPVEVAYRRGYFDQEMNQILSDPSDDTKGFFDPNTHENLTYMQLLHRCVPDPDTGLLMLQLMDKGSVLYQLTEDARKALQDARTTLSVGLFQGQSVTVWELLFSRYVPDHRRQDLLRKYKAGTVTISEMITLLTAIISTAEGQGHGTALARKPVQRETAPLAENGEATGPWQEQEQEQEQEQQLQRSLKSHTVEVSAGGFQGRKVSLWELLFSKYVSEAKRQELLGQARARSLALDELARLLTVLVEEAAEQSSKMKFPGLRRQVTASDLVDSGIIDKDTLADLVQGSKTVEEVTEMASVKRYLDGTGCIAGVLVPSKADPTKMEKMSIYQAMWKGILRQGTALVLLEAQAATGFLIDPLTNEKLSVDEAISSGLVGSELHEKLLSAERAVTGYTDPYTGDQISLFQAMKKELIVKEHGIRLLEAQIATGGIIDPVHSHRLPVEVAYRRGYFDQEMNQILSDPSDDTKGFFDPNTHENLTYMQLLHRCVPDPDTGLLMLQLMDKGSVLYQLTEDARKALQDARTTLSVGLFQGQSVTVWELLFSRYVPDHRRQDLLRKYKAGTVTISEMITLLTAIISTAEGQGHGTALARKPVQRETAPLAENGEATGPWQEQEQEQEQEQQLQRSLKSHTVEVSAGGFQGRKVSLWELLFSKYVSEAKRQELLGQARARSLALDELARLLTVLVEEAAEQSSKMKFPGLRRQVTASDLVDSGIIDKDTLADLVQGSKTVEEVTEMASVKRYLDGTGCIAGVLVPSKADPTKMEKMSIYQAMWKGILRQGTALVLLEAQAATGFLIDPLTNEKLSVDEAISSGLVGSELHEKLLSAERAVTGYTDPYTGDQISLFQAMKKELIVKEHGIRLLEAQIATGGIIDPVHSHRLPVEVAYRRGYFDQEMNQILSDPSDDTKGFFDPNTHENLTYMQLLHRCVPDPDTGLLMLQLMDKGSVLYQLTEDARKALQDARTTLSVGLFQGQSVTVWELLFSRYVPDHRRQDLLRKYKAGTVTISEMITLLTAIISTAEGQGHGTALARKPVQRETAPLAENGEATGPWQQLQRSLKSHTVEVSAGGFQGRKVSLWELLFSKYVSEAKRQELLGQARARSLALDELARLLTVLVEEAAEQSSKMKFPGLRRQVTASDLVDSGIIDKDTLADLVQGSKTVEEVTEMASVKRYLDGTGCIAGVLVPSKADPTKMEKMSIYQAMWKGILRQGTALVLLEAQAATGFLIDPLTNEKLSVDEAISSGLVGSELHEKLLSAERAVTGYTDPYTGDQISLFQAMKKELIVKEHSIRLLEAQIATGGIIDPVHSHRLPVEVAYRRGYFDQEMNQILSDPSDDTKGFFDPNTHENLTYMQLLHRCVPDPMTGLYFLQGYSPKTMQKMSGSPQNNKSSNMGSNLLDMGEGGSSFIAGVFIQTMNKKMSIYDAMMRGLLTPGTALVLLEAQAASGFLTDPVKNEKLSVKEALTAGLIGRDFYEKLLSAEGAVTGYTEPYTGHKISLFQAMKKEFIVKEHAIRLLEAQIATGGIIDPVHSHRLPVEVAYKRGYFDQEMCQFLSNPKNQTRSCFDPNTHENLTYTQLLRRCVPDPDTGLLMLHVMDKGSVLYQLNKDARKALQDARTTLSVGLFQGQSVTVWELLFSRYIPDHQREELLRKYKAGTVTIPEMITILTTIITRAETEKRDLSSSTVIPNNEVRTSQPVQDTQSQEQQLRKSLKSATIYVTAGEFQGQNISLLDLLFSKYIPQGKRQELLELYRAGILTTEQVATVVTTIINRTESANAMLMASARSPHKAVTRAEENGDDFSTQDEQLDNILKSTTVDVPAGEFQGKEVSVWDLLFSDYIPEEKRQELLELYRERVLTVEQMITVVTTVIKKKASTSRKFLIADKTSGKDTVSAAEEKEDDSTKEEPWETALKTTVVDVEVGEFQGHKVSVWDLLHSKYIPEENRKELLELYQAGELTLDQVKTVVSTIVTKAEAARAEQLANASGPRAESTVAEAEHTCRQDRTWEETLKSTTVEMSMDEFQGKEVSVWDLLFSDYIPEEKRQELLELYCAGTLALERLIIVITALIKKKASTGRKFLIAVKTSDKDTVSAEEKEDDSTKEEPWETALKTTVVDVEVGEFQGHKVSVWDLLHSKYIPEENRKELLELYQAGELTLDQVKTVVSTIVTKAEAARAEQLANASGPRAESTVAEAEHTCRQDRTWEETLKSTTVEMSMDEFQGKEVSVWDLLFSDYIPEEKRQELLELYRAGTLTIQELVSTTSSIVTDSKERHLATLPQQTVDLLQSEGSYITFGPFQEQRVSVWELLSSKQVSEYKREAHLDTYGTGGLTVNKITITTTVIIGPQHKKRHH
ncbi:LOW QUALITY PROTEIN: epiplakin [Falco biarmicus]|uniref:LOW QUALITY PROTEIN: epiplakin n=1 Tax=Falco biarmicus TaxID=345155 RepID=UPI0024BCDFA2|nr:LOW QUALITY PROTEIN: epiplakin [Falco biarmicus]